jgi:regulator of RNase E activity RraA
MNQYLAFRDISPTTLADVLPAGQVLSAAIHPLWSGMPRIAGPAFTVRCGPGDNLMLHAAIYRAPPGAVVVVVVEGGDTEFALAGGNVCAVAHRRQIAGFVLDGSVRDISEIRALRFPVFARGVVPVAGSKRLIGALNAPVRCGGALIEPRDAIVADEEGIVVVRYAALEVTLQAASAKLARESTQTLDAWEADHRARIDRILRDNGFTD